MLLPVRLDVSRYLREVADLLAARELGRLLLSLEVCGQRLPYRVQLVHVQDRLDQGLLEPGVSQAVLTHPRCCALLPCSSNLAHRVVRLDALFAQREVEGSLPWCLARHFSVEQRWGLGQHILRFGFELGLVH